MGGVGHLQVRDQGYDVAGADEAQPAEPCNVTRTANLARTSMLVMHIVITQVGKYIGSQ